MLDAILPDGEPDPGPTVAQRFPPNTRVTVTFTGTGDVFPVGLHVRAGRVLKDGQLEDTVMIVLDDPIYDLSQGSTTEVVNMPVELVKLGEPTAEDLQAAREGSRGPKSDRTGDLLYGRR